jgi:hypothetical protein
MNDPYLDRLRAAPNHLLREVLLGLCYQDPYLTGKAVDSLDKLEKLGLHSAVSQAPFSAFDAQVAALQGRTGRDEKIGSLTALSVCELRSGVSRGREWARGVQVASR